MTYIITNTSVSVFINGEERTLTSDHPAFKAVVSAIKKDDEQGVINLLNTKKRIEDFGEGRVTYKDGVVYYEGEAINNYLTKKIVKLQSEGFTVKPLLNFLDNLQDNPSYRAREELYKFLEYGNLPITEDGYFIAYKKVRDDFKDIFSGKFDNSVGSVCEMPRKDVDDDSDRTCSAGLHFASKEYMSHYGSGSANKVVALKINPADVVSIPRDYNNTKGRCCRYEVVSVLGESNSFKSLEDTPIFDQPLSTTTKNPYGVKGITYVESRGKYKVQRTTRGVGSRHIGYFETLEEAKAVAREKVPQD